MTTGLFLRLLVRISSARPVLAAGNSMELYRPCSAAALTSVVYLASEVTGRSSRLRDCALAPSEITIPDSRDRQTAVAVAHLQPIRVLIFFSFVIGGTLTPGDLFERGSHTCRRRTNYNGYANGRIVFLGLILGAWVKCSQLEAVRVREAKVRMTGHNCPPNGDGPALKN